MSDKGNDTFKPEVDQQGGGPGAQTGSDGGEYNDVASGGRSEVGSADEGQHAEADED